jgi:enamine deaminase RidA (YjgF/YER057c/UK114 family)
MIIRVYAIICAMSVQLDVFPGIPPALRPKSGGAEVSGVSLELGRIHALYLELGAARDFLNSHSTQVLGVVCHGIEAPFVAEHIPVALVEMPQLGPQPLLEIWTVGDQVQSGRSGNIHWARTADFLFGCYRQPPHESLESVTYQAYQEVFSLLQAEDVPNLLRVWNYFAAINVDEADGVERYKHFCIGRHDAFARFDRLQSEDIPAASAVGSHGGQFVLYFIAATRRGTAVENDRQVSAYDYPPQYGPRSPLFSRATQVSWLKDPQLFISGTASIVGHASTCLGDVEQQTSETLKNISRVLGLAFPERSHENFAQLRSLKVYIRHAGDFPLIRSIIEDSIGKRIPCLYLLADICRSELLLEIEAIAGDA